MFQIFSTLPRVVPLLASFPFAAKCIRPFGWVLEASWHCCNGCATSAWFSCIIKYHCAVVVVVAFDRCRCRRRRSGRLTRTGVYATTTKCQHRTVKKPFGKTIPISTRWRRIWTIYFWQISCKTLLQDVHRQQVSLWDRFLDALGARFVRD